MARLKQRKPKPPVGMKDCGGVQSEGGGGQHEASHMSGANAISATMAIALDMAQRHDGRLVRLAGGFWTWKGAPRNGHNGHPVDYAGTSTIEALVKRGRMQYVEWRPGRRGSFPVEVRIFACVGCGHETSQARERSDGATVIRCGRCGTKLAVF